MEGDFSYCASVNEECPSEGRLLVEVIAVPVTLHPRVLDLSVKLASPGLARTLKVMLAGVPGGSASSDDLISWEALTSVMIDCGADRLSQSKI